MYDVRQRTVQNDIRFGTQTIIRMELILTGIGKTARRVGFGGEVI